MHAARWLAALALAACSVPNPEHCSNLDGAATCTQRGTGQHCSLCVSDNDGCVDQPPSGQCAVSTTDPQTTTADPQTTTAPTTSTSTSDDSTSSTSTSSTATTSTSSTTDTTSSTTDTTATTDIPPICGNNVHEGNEPCDGKDLDGQNCNKVNPKWGGGTLQCNADCTLFDQSMCCPNIGQGCLPNSMDPNMTCCGDSTCVLLTCQ